MGTDVNCTKFVTILVSHMQNFKYKHIFSPFFFLENISQVLLIAFHSMVSRLLYALANTPHLTHTHRLDAESGSRESNVAF